LDFPFIETSILVTISGIVMALAFFFNRKKSEFGNLANETNLVRKENLRIRVNNGESVFYLEERTVTLTDFRIIIEGRAGEESISLYFLCQSQGPAGRLMISASMIEAFESPGPSGVLIPVLPGRTRKLTNYFIETAEPEDFTQPIKNRVLASIQ